MPNLVLYLVVMVSTQTLMAVSLNAAGVLAPVVAPDLGYSPAILGPYAGVMGVAILAGGTLIDGAMRRYGGARTLQAGMAITVAGVLSAATGNPFMVGLSSVLIGFGGGTLVPAATHLLWRVAPAHRVGMVVAIVQCGIPAGYGLAGVAFPLLLRVLNWRESLVVAAVALGLMIPLFQIMRPALDAHRDPTAPLGGRAFIAPVRLAWTTPALRLLGWTAFSYVTVQMAFLTYLVSYVKTGLGFSHVQAGAALTVSQVAAVFSRLFFGWLQDRVGRHFLVLGVVGAASGAVALLLGMAGPGWPYGAIMAMAVVGGIFIMGWNGVYIAGVAKLAPEGRSGTAIGGTQIFTAIGSAVGPLIFAGVLGASGSYGLGFVVASAFALVMAARLLWTDRQLPARHGNHR